MTHHRRQGNTIRASIILFFLFIVGFSASAQDGQALFTSNCASCHSLYKRATGPALYGVNERGPWTDRKQLHLWVQNPAAYMKHDNYTAGLFKEYGTLMTAFGASLNEKDVDAIFDYIKKVPPPPTEGGPNTDNQTAGAESDNTLLFGILTIILAVVSFVLLQVNSNLKKLTDEKEGLGGIEPVPFYRNKAYIALITIIVFLIGGYMTVTGAIGLGRTQKYEPAQPIFYSHKVHAGTNQISCLYCHGNTEQGKQANIPAVNICMNCHMAINEYTGKDKLYNAEGVEVNGTAEIAKLLKYAGYEKGKVWDASKAKPIEWVRIHNLPDHVYFNHSQHVAVGKVQCQTCHGEIQKMDEVQQFADLSMGWCINCHRTTQVQFKDNGFYSIYEKYHEEIRNGTLDSTKITVEKIGGTECQKCHY